jgi:hypothetical protein
MKAIKHWILTHKALMALVAVLLTTVPVAQEYELVDRDGRGIDYYKVEVCRQYEGQEYARIMACDAALEMMFSEQLAVSGYYDSKRPLIPGLFYRKKIHNFRWNGRDFRERHRRVYSFVKRRTEERKNR